MAQFVAQLQCPSEGGAYSCGIFHNYCTECKAEWCEQHSPEAHYADAINCPTQGVICPACREDHEATCSACADVRAADYAEEMAVARWKGEY